jgi:hypothetical protein
VPRGFIIGEEVSLGFGVAAEGIEAVLSTRACREAATD